MVLANNAIRLREIQDNIIGDHAIFNNVHQVSLLTLAHILKRNQVQIKQLYFVPFERNSETVTCKYFCACEQSEEFSTVCTLLVLWQSILNKTAFLYAQQCVVG